MLQSSLLPLVSLAVALLAPLAPAHPSTPGVAVANHRSLVAGKHQLLSTRQSDDTDPDDTTPDDIDPYDTTPDDTDPSDTTPDDTDPNGTEPYCDGSEPDGDDSCIVSGSPQDCEENDEDCPTPVIGGTSLSASYIYYSYSTQYEISYTTTYDSSFTSAAAVSSFGSGGSGGGASPSSSPSSSGSGSTGAAANWRDSRGPAMAAVGLFGAAVLVL